MNTSSEDQQRREDGKEREQTAFPENRKPDINDLLAEYASRRTKVEAV